MAMTGPIVARPVGLEAVADAPVAVAASTACWHSAVAAEAGQPSREEQTDATALFVESLKDTLVKEVDAGVEQQVQAAWRKGTLAAQSFQREQDRNRSALEQALEEFKKTQAALEAENASLKQAVAGLAGRVTQITNVARSAWATAPPGAVAAAPVVPRTPACPWQLATPPSAASLLRAGSVQLPSDQSETSMWYPGFGSQCEVSEAFSLSHPAAHSLAAHSAAAAAAMLGDFPDLPPFPFPGKMAPPGAPPAFGGDFAGVPRFDPAALRLDADGAERAAAAAPGAPAPSPSAAPLSLAEALGFGELASLVACQSMPMPSMPPPPGPPRLFPSGSRPPTPPPQRGSQAPTLASVEEEAEEEAEMYVFCLTLRVAEGGELGIEASAQSSTNWGLIIEDVVVGGAADAWNRQCGSSGAPEKVLRAGDKIVRVNDLGDDVEAMLHECKSSRLLRLQIVRLGGASVAAEETTAETSTGFGSCASSSSSASPPPEPSYSSSSVERAASDHRSASVEQDDDDDACMLPEAALSRRSASYSEAATPAADAAQAPWAEAGDGEAVERAAAEPQRSSRGCRRGRRGARAGRGTRGR